MSMIKDKHKNNAWGSNLTAEHAKWKTNLFLERKHFAVRVELQLQKKLQAANH